MTERGFASDDAIEGEAQDSLGRAGFAERLATAVQSAITRKGIVIGLTGPWGSGKSSIKNLLLERLEKGNAAIDVLEFNPWVYEDRDQLATEFFAELALACGKGDTDEARDRRAKLLAYASKVANVGSIALNAVVPIGLPLASVGAKGLGRISEVLELGSKGLREAMASKSLNALKKELIAELAKLARPILVVIDDIDRLDQREVRLLFQLVKANSDFPNVSFVLLYAKDRVERALADSVEDGSKFLEKIVSVSFDVPALTREDTKRLFHDAAKPLLSKEDISVDPKRWQHAVDNCISPYLDTVRAVKRFTNMLSFYASVFEEEEGFNVDFVDLAVLEVLRQNEPNVYRQLPHLAPALCDGPYWSLSVGLDDETRRRLYLDIVDAAKDEGRQPMVRACLRSLFPQVDWSSGEYADFSNDEVVLLNRRICTSAYFPKYFYFDVGLGTISESEFQQLLVASANSDNFRARLASYASATYIQVFQMLRARLDEMPKENYAAIFEAVYREVEVGSGSAHIPRDVFPHAVDTDLLIAMLRRVTGDAAKRKLILETAVKSECYVMALMLVVVEDGVRDDKESMHEKILSDLLYEELLAWALSVIRKWASTGTLIQVGPLYDVLYYWGWLASPAEPIAWIHSLAGNPDQVASYLDRVVAPQLKSEADVMRAARRSHSLAYAEDLSPLKSDLDELKRRTLPDSLRWAVDFALTRIRGLSQKEQDAIDAAILKENLEPENGV